jgi:NADPH-dependent 7-cyano-7-deazaguanine reductase QueF
MNTLEQIRELKEYLESREKQVHQEEINKIILDHINSKIEPHYTCTSIGGLEQLVEKIGPKYILEAIDASAFQYLRYENLDTPTRESVDTFYNKIGGIAVNKHRGYNPWTPEDK